MSEEFIVAGECGVYFVKSAYDNSRDYTIAKQAGFNNVEDYHKYIKKQCYLSDFMEFSHVFFRDREECQDLADRLNKRVNNDFPFEEGDIVKSNTNNKRYKVIKIMEERDRSGDNVFLQNIDDTGYYIAGNTDKYVKVKTKEELDQGDKFRIGTVKYEVICCDSTAYGTLYFVKGVKPPVRKIIASDEIDEVL